MLRIISIDQAQRFITRKAVRLAEAEQIVAPILEDVRKRGDERCSNTLGNSTACKARTWPFLSRN